MTTVLIVEDTPNFRRWLLQAVPRLLPGCEATSVADAAAADIEVASHTPDVVLLDLGLPLDGHAHRADPEAGLSLLRSWRAAGLPSRIVVLSSHRHLADLCRQAGADEFVPKDTPRLLEALDAALTAAPIPTVGGH
jgi:two-component system response regulator PhoP